MIKMVDDFGAPAVVALADIATSEKKESWNKPLGIGISAASYLLGGFMGIGGNFVKQMGVASFPWAAGSIYQYIKEAAPISARTSSKVSSRIGRYPAPAHAEGFENIRLV